MTAANLTARHPVTATALLATVALTACGGGGGGGGGTDLNVEGRPLADIEPNSITLSDMHVRLANGTPVRVSDVSCTPSGFCEMTVSGQPVSFQVDEDDDDGVSGTVYNTLGDWNDMAAFAVYGRVDGAAVRYAAVGGVVHPNSLPSIGSATWRGDMVGLDDNNRAVRGGAEITVANFTDPLADVTLTPRARAAMRWRGLPIADGGFSGSRGPEDYIRGEFYGRDAGEAGGVFERNGVVGAFGAERE